MNSSDNSSNWTYNLKKSQATDSGQENPPSAFRNHPPVSPAAADNVTAPVAYAEIPEKTLRMKIQKTVTANNRQDHSAPAGQPPAPDCGKTKDAGGNPENNPSVNPAAIIDTKPVAAMTDRQRKNHLPDQSADQASPRMAL
jgi:hypothetical protein